MNQTLKRTLAGVAVLAATATTVPLLTAGPAAAAPPGGSLPLTISPSAGGNSATPFNFDLGANPACPGDSAAGYYISSFIVPSSTNLDTLKFGAFGPTGVSGFSDALYSAAGDAYVGASTDQAVTPGGPGGISGVPTFNSSSVYTSAGSGPPAGTYYVGIACHVGPPSSSTQLQKIWSKVITVSRPGGGPATYDWAPGAAAPAPTITTVTPGDGTLQVTFGTVTADPAVSGYTATAYLPGTSTVAGTPATGSGTPLTITGLTNGTTYDVKVSATNGVGSPAESAAVSGTPSVTYAAPVVTATGGVQSLDVTWTHTGGGTPSAYVVTATPTSGTPETVTVAGTDPKTASFTGLVPGNYTVTVQPNYTDPGASAPAGTDTAIVADTNEGQLIQTITADRAQVNAPIFQQDCDGVGTGVGYDTNPCTVDLTETGVDSTVQYYEATGKLWPIRVIDTRDTDRGWVVKGDVADQFTATGGAFDSLALGWKPNKLDQSAALGNGYTMTVQPGAEIQPWTTSELKTGDAVLMTTVANGSVQQGLGFAVADADLTLRIPVSAPSGSYSAAITFTLTNLT